MRHLLIIRERRRACSRSRQHQRQQRAPLRRLTYYLTDTGRLDGEEMWDGATNALGSAARETLYQAELGLFGNLLAAAVGDDFTRLMLLDARALSCVQEL